MFFYIAHNINHYMLSSDDADGAKNVRTLIYGGICYILLHAYLYNADCPYYLYRHYIWYLFVLDALTMAVVYKNYYGRSIICEINSVEHHDYDEKTHKYAQKKSKTPCELLFGTNESDNSTDIIKKSDTIIKDIINTVCDVSNNIISDASNNIIDCSNNIIDASNNIIKN